MARNSHPPIRDRDHRRWQGRRGREPKPEGSWGALAVLILGFVMGLKLNSAFDGPGLRYEASVRLTVALSLTLTAIMIIGWALMVGQQTLWRRRQATEVILGRLGPYGISRNPIITALVVLYSASAALADAPVALLPLPFAFIMIHAWVVVPNERLLREDIGAAYEAYCRDVPRWV